MSESSRGLQSELTFLLHLGISFLLMRLDLGLSLGFQASWLKKKNSCSWLVSPFFPLHLPN